MESQSEKRCQKGSIGRRTKMFAILIIKQFLKQNFLVKDSPSEGDAIATTSTKKKKRRKKKFITLKDLSKDHKNLEQEENLSEPLKRLEGARFRFINEQLYVIFYKKIIFLDLPQILKKHNDFLQKIKMLIKLIIKVFNYK